MNSSLFRHVLLSAATFLFFTVSCKPLHAAPQRISSTSVQKQLADLEASSGGHLGIAAINTANDKHIEYRAEERFSLWSTCKVMVVSTVLKKSENDHHLLQEKIMYRKEDLGYAPITEKHLADGMTVSELCAAAIMYSDNTAMNLLIRKLGGPKVVIAFARSIGDNTFQFYKLNPLSMSVIYPSNLRVRSTPAAMEKSLQKLALSNALGSAQRKQLLTWMKHNTTGDTRIRAGVPKAWTVADKTGSGDSYGVTNDIGIIWPPASAPIVIAIYFNTKNKKDTGHHDDVIAAATRILVHEFVPTKH